MVTRVHNSPPLKYSVHHNSVSNLHRAVMERVFFHKDPVGNFVEPFRPVLGTFDRVTRAFTTKFDKQLQCATRHLIGPSSRQEFADMYTARRHTIYQAAVDSLNIKPVSRVDSYGAPFVKAEKINFTSKPDAAPRVIQPRTPRYNVEVGRYLKPLEGYVYRSIAKTFGGKTVFKGMDLCQQGLLMRRKWERFLRPVAVGLDAERFDQHVSPDTLTWEHTRYRKCYSGQDAVELNRLLQWQLHNRMFGRCPDGEVMYRTHGVRCSGDMNTAVGNCLIMCASIYSYANELGIKIELANNGDDCVVIMEHVDLDRFVAHLTSWFSNIGFVMKVENPVYVFEQISFCQMSPVWDGRTWIMVRDPRVALAKDCISICPLSTPELYRRWLAAVGEGGVHIAGGIPIWDPFYRCMMRSAHGYTPLSGTFMESGMMRLAQMMDRTSSVISDESRVSFYNAFGIDPAQQLVIEQAFTEHDWVSPGPPLRTWELNGCLEFPM